MSYQDPRDQLVAWFLELSSDGSNGNWYEVASRMLEAGWKPPTHEEEVDAEGFNAAGEWAHP